MAHVSRFLFLGLLNLLLILSPLAAQASVGGYGCAMSAQASQDHDTHAPMPQVHQAHAHHSQAHDGHGHHGSAPQSAGAHAGHAPAGQAICCSLGCLADLGPLAAVAPAIPATIEMQSTPTLTNLSDLTGPSGLRRPPRA